MKNEIKIFENPDFGQVRVIIENGEPLFVAKDVAVLLGYQNPTEAIATHCKSGDIEKRYVAHLNGVGGTKLQVIKEANLYRLIMRSKLQNAEKFQDWVVEEVLPSIRKTGSYSIKPMSPAEIIIAQGQALLALEQKQLELQEAQNRQAKDIEYLKTKAVHRPDYYSIIGFANKVKIKVGLEKAKKLGKMCVKLCKEKGYTTEKIDDPRFGYIRTYPHDVLEEIFAKEYNISFD
jgi:associated-antirepressor|nr:MAG TPA: repressor domain protein [Caudoviricetes sp.]